MPLKVIVSPVAEADKFAQTVEDWLQKIQEEFQFFNRKHAGKQAEVSRSVTFLATDGNLVCILYYSWQLSPGGSSLLVPLGPARPDRVQ